MNKTIKVGKISLNDKALLEAAGYTIIISSEAPALKTGDVELIAVFEGMLS